MSHSAHRRRTLAGHRHARRERRAGWVIVLAVMVVGGPALPLGAGPRPAMAPTAVSGAGEPGAVSREPAGPSTSAPSATPRPSVVEPTGIGIPDAGSGRFQAAAGSSRRVGNGAHVLAYRVEVEQGLPFEASDFAAAVDRTLQDDRGWGGVDGVALRRTPTARTRVVLASPRTTDRLCAPLRTRGRVSCRNGFDVVVNARRWAKGARSYGTDLAGYRTYLVNHEMGHRLGRRHVSCPAPGQPAPVMLQQTKGLQRCRPNPWP
ncbi:DUF3152 domain-containing protein [Solicola sp. PLA-1-18]|uniref:DUF3152 domain-containing protein n=1 Tax=Solicola sp. PLA-1-18 TaxID=3380532 RepID=UPI003B7C4B08